MDQNAAPRPEWAVRAEDFPEGGTTERQLAFLVRYAVLAPSSHNSQPWKFRIRDGEVAVHADRDRWLRVADADQRELFISVGCSIENLVVAARRFGFEAKVRYPSEPGDEYLAATVRFAKGARPSTEDPLFRALTQRHTNHKPFDAAPIPEADLAAFRDACGNDGLGLIMTGDEDLKRAVEALVVRADAVQFADPAFREELGEWIGRGVFGTPWLISKVGQLAVTHLDLGRSTARKDAAALMSAPVLGVIASREESRRAELETGRAFVRIGLTATVLGLAVQPVSQVVQIPEIKAELERLLLPPGMHAQQPFRLGYASPEADHTPRRPIEDVLLD